MIVSCCKLLFIDAAYFPRECPSDQRGVDVNVGAPISHYVVRERPRPLQTLLGAYVHCSESLVQNQHTHDH